ncbi:MAG: hypothetical protein R3C10_00795 [Pirellulales bacterium]
MAASSGCPQPVRRDPYAVIVWERHGRWADLLRRLTNVEVRWYETRGWDECRTSLADVASGCVVLAIGERSSLSERLGQVQQLRRLRTSSPVFVIVPRAMSAGIDDAPRIVRPEWLFREAGATDVVGGAAEANRIARLIERDYCRQSPSTRRLDQLIVDQLPWATSTD